MEPEQEEEESPSRMSSAVRGLRAVLLAASAALSLGTAPSALGREQRRLCV